jgi:hypothetical protein
MVENTPKMDPKAKAISIIFLLLVTGLIIGLILSAVTLNSVENRIDKKISELNENYKKVVAQYIRENWRHFSEIYILVTVVISMNLALLLGLLYSYYKTFRETYSNFIMGLILFLGVLFVQSLLSLPVIQYAFGQTITDLGLVNVLPNLFETIALIILFYLSSE